MANGVCLADLAQTVKGDLLLAAMPPRDGEWTLISRIVFEPLRVAPGDLYWDLAGEAIGCELAFLRGAAGVVTAVPAVGAWPGRVCVRVEQPVEALARLLGAALAGAGEGDGAGSCRPGEFSGTGRAELKDLQLCPRTPTVIYPPTCERPRNRTPNRCRRAA